MFAGTLTIACPTTPAYIVPLLVTIANGTTSPGMTATAHINISGVLGGGSRVTILGGSYTFAVNVSSSFLQLTAATTITLEIVGVFFTMPHNFSDGTTAVLSAHCSAISESSTLSTPPS